MAILSGSDRDDLLRGTLSDDTIYGLDGHDVLIGGEGNDTLDGGAGNDRIHGGNGDDTITDLDGDNRVFGGRGQDTIITGSGNDKINSGRGNDIVDAGDGNNRIRTGRGDDTVTAGSGDDRIDSGRGNDIVDAGDGNNRIRTGRGDDTVNAGSGDDRIDSGRGNDFVDAGGGNNRIRTGRGDDTIIAGSGDDRIDSGRGNDFVDAGDGNNRIRTGRGDDTVTAGSGKDTISGGRGNDRISAGANDDMVYGNKGNDYLSGDDGNDTLEGGSGDDTLNGGSGRDRLIGGAGDDLLIGGEEVIAAFDHRSRADYQSATSGINASLSETSTVTGDSSVGTDTLVRVDRVDGSDFNDVFVADTSFRDVTTGNSIRIDGRGGDDIITGNGNTQARYGSADAAVTVDLATGTAHGTDAGDIAGVGTDTLSGVNRVVGSDFDDTLLGSDTHDEEFRGTAGNDYIDGRGGDDRASYVSDETGVIANLSSSAVTIGTETVAAGTVRDGFGDTDTLVSIESIRSSLHDDVLIGSDEDNSFRIEGGNNIINGGTGTDRVDYRTRQAGSVTVDLSTGTATNALGGSDTLSSIEDVRGSRFDDLITGDSNDNYLDARMGDDIIYGGAGQDRIRGRDGNDVLAGGEHDDTLEGGAGSDDYIFARGDDADIIEETAGSVSDFDRILFGDDISKDQLWFQKTGDDLQILVTGTDDSMTISDWYSASEGPIEQIVSGDGDTLTEASVELLVDAMATFDPPTSESPAHVEDVHEAINLAWDIA